MAEGINNTITVRADVHSTMEENHQQSRYPCIATDSKRFTEDGSFYNDPSTARLLKDRDSSIQSDEDTKQKTTDFTKDEDKSTIVHREPKAQDEKKLDYKKLAIKGYNFTSGDAKAIANTIQNGAKEIAEITESDIEPEQLLETIGNNITSLNPEDVLSSEALTVTSSSVLFEGLFITLNKGMQCSRITKRSESFSIISTIKERVEYLQQAEYLNKPVVTSDEFNYLCNLIYLEPPIDYIPDSTMSANNKYLINLLHLDRQQVCISSLKELLDSVCLLFIGGKHSKTKHSNLNLLLVALKELRNDTKIQENDKLLKKIKDSLVDYGIKITFDIHDTEDAEKPSSMLIKINKNKLYKELKKTNKLPHLKLLINYYEKNQSFFDTLATLADYDPKKIIRHKKQLTAMILATLAGFIPIIPVSDGIRTGIYTYGLTNHRSDKKQAIQSVEKVIGLLNDNNHSLEAENYQLLMEYLQQTLELKKEHLDIKIKQAIGHTSVHATSGAIAIPSAALGPVFSLARSTVKISAKVAIIISGAVKRNIDDNKKRANGSFITLADLFGLIKTLYLAAVENNNKDKQDLMQQLACLLFNINEDIFLQLVQTKLVQNNKLKLSIYYP